MLNLHRVIYLEVVILLMENNQEIIKGKFRVIKSLNGETRTTLLAEDIESGLKVIIKKRQFKNLTDWKVLELFEREIDTLRQIDYQRIPKYIDSFTVEKNKNTQYYLIQEYIEGMNLKDKVSNERPFTEAETIKIMREILDILKYLHNFHPPIIHRDINPSNLVMTPGGDVFLIDFGAVKDIMEYNPNNATIVGTYGYMPIEQTMGKASTSSDIYSLGMTAIFLLTGKNPSKLDISRGKPDFSSYCDISQSFMQMLNNMIEPVMEDRIQNVEEVYNELRLLKIGNPYRNDHLLQSNKTKKEDESKSNFDKLIEKYKPKDEHQNQTNNIEDSEPAFIINDPIFRNQTLKPASIRDLEKYVDKIYIPPKYDNIKIWKDFDSLTFYFKNNRVRKSRNSMRPLISSTMLLIPLMMLFVYIGMETLFIEPFFVFVILAPLFALFMRNIKTKDTSSIQLKNNYIKIVRYKNGRPESRVIGYYDIKDIYVKEYNATNKLIIITKTNEMIEVETDMAKEELDWIVNTCKSFIRIAINVSNTTTL